MKKTFLPLILFFILSLYIRPARSEGFIENYEEVIDNIVFEHIFSDLPTFEEGFEKDLGILGDVTGNVYVSAGQAYIRLPARIITRYDTTLEPFSSNVVEMAVEPYNGEGPEMKLIFGLNLSVVYDPLGPSWLTGKASFGDFDTGFNFEGDFTPPIDGEWEATSSESFTGSIGIKKALSFDIGVNVRFNLQGKMVKGSSWEDDPYAEIQDNGEKGIVLRDSQHAPQYTVKDNDLYTSIDYHFDFESYDLYYVTAITAEIDSIIMGFSFMGSSWTWEFPTVIPLESHAVDFTIWTNEDESDDTTFQMTRVIAPSGGGIHDYPFFDISTTPSTGEPGQTILSEVALTHTVQNPPRGYVIQPAQLYVYDEENVMVGSVTVTAADYQRGSINLPLTLPSFTDQHYSYRLSLQPPDLSQWYGPSMIAPQNATLTFSRRLPDLHPVRLSVSPKLPGSLILEHGSYVGAINIVEVMLENSGNAPSPATEIKLWLYEGLPSVPAFSITSEIIQNAALIGANPVPPLQVGGGSRHEFTFLLPQNLEDMVVTYIIEVDGSHLVPETSEENNRAFTTVDVQKTVQGIQWVLGTNHYAFSSLVQVFEVPTGQAVADMSQDLAGRVDEIPNEMLVEELEALTYLESIVLEELETFVPTTLLETAKAVNQEQTQKISEVMAVGIKDTAILEILNIQTRFIGEINSIWQATIKGHVESDTATIHGAEIQVSYENGDYYMNSIDPSNGSYVLNYLPPGDATITVSAPGHENYTEQVTLMPSSTTKRTIKVSPIWGSLRITIKDRDTDEPLKGTTITVDGRTSMTDSSGEVIFEEMRASITQIVAKRRGYESYHSTITILPAQQISEQIMLDPTRKHDTSIIALNVIPGTVPLGDNATIALTIGNEGMWTEDAELTLYTNTTVIIEETLPLQRETYETRVYQWSTQYTEPAKYRLSAYITPVTGENETADNTFAYGLVQVVDDKPPDITPLTDQSTTTGTEITLLAQASDNHEVYTMLWDLGDGTQKQGDSIHHKYTEPGDYTVKLTITDPSGNTAEEQLTVTVTEERTSPNQTLVIGSVAVLLLLALYLMRARIR